jgi:hypothetical protein
VWKRVSFSSVVDVSSLGTTVRVVVKVSETMSVDVGAVAADMVRGTLTWLGTVR